MEPLSVNVGLLRGLERSKTFPFGGAYNILKNGAKLSKTCCLNLTNRCFLTRKDK